MKFNLRITRDEIFETLRSFMPVRIALTDKDDDGEPERWITIYEPENLRIEAGEGIHLDFKLDVHWPLPLLPDHYTIKKVSGSLLPQIVCVDGSTSVAFALRVAEIDVSFLPSFMDNVVEGQVRDKLAAMQAKLIWKIAETMNISVELPGWIDPRKVAQVNVLDAALTLTKEALEIEAPLELAIYTGDSKDAQISFGGSEALEDEIDIPDSILG